MGGEVLVDAGTPASRVTVGIAGHLDVDQPLPGGAGRLVVDAAAAQYQQIGHDLGTGELMCLLGQAYGVHQIGELA